MLTYNPPAFPHGVFVTVFLPDFLSLVNLGLDKIP